MGAELKTLNERIAERVGEQLVDLIPEDQWQAIIDDEIKKFTTSTLPSMIRQMLEKEYMDRLRALVQQFALISWDEYGNQAASEELEKFIGAASGQLIAAMLSPAMSMVMQDLRGRLGY